MNVTGLCVRHPYDPAMWDFDVAGETARQRKKRHRMAAEICGRCPIRVSCSSRARQGREEGVWGGRVLPELPIPTPHRKKAAA